VRSYSTSQRLDHKQFDSEYDSLTRPDSFAMHKRSPTEDAWDSRPSMDTRALQAGAYGQVPTGNFTEKYTPRSPENAYTQDPEPTPQFRQQEFNNNAMGASSAMAYPDASQSHPGELDMWHTH
jgi:hypothetical protein